MKLQEMGLERTILERGGNLLVSLNMIMARHSISPVPQKMRENGIGGKRSESARSAYGPLESPCTAADTLPHTIHGSTGAGFLPRLRENEKGGCYTTPKEHALRCVTPAMGSNAGGFCVKKLKAWLAHSLRGLFLSEIVSKHSDEVLLPDGGKHTPTPPDILSQPFFIIHFPELPLTYLVGGGYL